MHKVVIAPDSFKGVLSAREVCDIISYKINRHYPFCQIVKVPVADGGEGSIEAFLCVAAPPPRLDAIRPQADFFLGDFLLRQRGPLFRFLPATAHVFRRPRSRAGGLSRHPASPDAPTAERKTGVCPVSPGPLPRAPLLRPGLSVPIREDVLFRLPALSNRTQNANGPEGRSLPARHLAI